MLLIFKKLSIYNYVISYKNKGKDLYFLVSEICDTYKLCQLSKYVSFIFIMYDIWRKSYKMKYNWLQYKQHCLNIYWY